VVVREALVSDLRQELLAMDSLRLERDRLRSERDQLAVERDRLAARHARLSAKCKQLSARSNQLVEERRLLRARQEEREKELRALRTYCNSAGFRIVVSAIRRLRHVPIVFTTTRAIARGIVRNR
jgi:uncharacterized protein (DUF3084 family)